MRRGLLAGLVAGLAVISVGACTRPAAPGEVILNVGKTELVAAIGFGNGFLGPEWRYLSVERVAVYSDGTAVAEGTRRITLPTAEVRELVGQLRQDLDGLSADLPPPPAARLIMDDATTVLRVRTATGALQSVSAYALDSVDEYPAGAHSARNRLIALADRVTRDGTPYQSDRIRIVASQTTGSAGTTTTDAHPWPADVPLPPAKMDGVRTADLSGAPATLAVSLLPMPGPNGQAPILRTSDGQLYRVSWRYLLPHE